MDARLINGTLKPEELKKSIIAGNISNAHEVLKTEKEVQFESLVRKGEVEVVAINEIKEQYWTKVDIDRFNNELEALIKKGEKEFLTKEEWAYLEKGQKDLEELTQKAVCLKKGNVENYVPVWVLEKAGSGEGSRGGKIIGHTKSGKPIYGHYPHTMKNPHKDFTSEEHKEAAKLHNQRREETLKQHFDSKPKKKNETDAEYESRKKIQIETARRGEDIGFLDKQREQKHLQWAEQKESNKE